MEILVDFNTPRGYVKYVTTDDGETWALEGECNRCGECCEKFKMTLKELADDNGKCNKFSYESNNGVRQGKCAIREMRPAFCMLYPRDPFDKLPKKCSYSWVRVN